MADEKNKKAIVLALVSIGVFLAVAITLNEMDKVSNSKLVPQAQAAQPTYEDVDFGPYMRAMQKNIKKHWTPPPGNHTVEVIFKVHKNGKMSDVHFREMPNDIIKDLVALKAIIDSSPDFPPLPEGSPEWVDIQFTLSSNDHK